MKGFYFSNLYTQLLSSLLIFMHRGTIKVDVKRPRLFLQRFIQKKPIVLMQEIGFIRILLVTSVQRLNEQSVIDMIYVTNYKKTFTGYLQICWMKLASKKKSTLLTSMNLNKNDLNNIYCTVSARAFQFYMSIHRDNTLHSIPA